MNYTKKQNWKYVRFNGVKEIIIWLQAYKQLFGYY